MRGRPRWTRWLLAGAVAAGLGAVPVAARPERQPQTGPLVVEVRPGDCLWTLARAYGDPRRDVREVVAELMEVNQVSPGELQPGMELEFPAGWARPPD